MQHIYEPEVATVNLSESLLGGYRSIEKRDIEPSLDTAKREQDKRIVGPDHHLTPQTDPHKGSIWPLWQECRVARLSLVAPHHGIHHPPL